MREERWKNTKEYGRCTGGKNEKWPRCHERKMRRLWNWNVQNTWNEEIAEAWNISKATNKILKSFIIKYEHFY